jgi:hypothetical protein
MGTKTEQEYVRKHHAVHYVLENFEVQVDECAKTLNK